MEKKTAYQIAEDNLKVQCKYLPWLAELSPAQKDLILCLAEDTAFTYHNSVRPEVVVPKKREINYDDPIMFQKKDETWNICIDRIKSLNPTLTFTELNHTAPTGDKSDKG